MLDNVQHGLEMPGVETQVVACMAHVVKLVHNLVPLTRVSCPERVGDRAQCVTVLDRDILLGLEHTLQHSSGEACLHDAQIVALGSRGLLVGLDHRVGHEKHVLVAQR